MPVGKLRIEDGVGHPRSGRYQDERARDNWAVNCPVFSVAWCYSELLWTMASVWSASPLSLVLPPMSQFPKASGDLNAPTSITRQQRTPESHLDPARPQEEHRDDGLVRIRVIFLVPCPTPESPNGLASCRCLPRYTPGSTMSHSHPGSCPKAGNCSPDITVADEQRETAMAMTMATRRTSSTNRLPTPSRNEPTATRTNTTR